MTDTRKSDTAAASDSLTRITVTPASEGLSAALAADLTELPPYTTETVAVIVPATWDDLARLRTALHDSAEVNHHPDTIAALDALEARLGAAHQTLPNPLDQHLPTP